MEDGLFPGWRAFDREDGLEEERRLCYVGITRARERLWLTGAERRTLYGKTDYTRESQFLRELDKKLIEGDGIYEKKTRDKAEGAFIDGASSSTPFKPFDQLKYARQQTKKNAAAGSGSTESFTAGDRISHPKFGEGSVLSCDGKIIEVQFEGGIKKMALGFAPLKKL
ncbi:MAG: ATP-binding protein, partial [Firmicutes bacterium]|nr:ATP-binding protein [Bacillota bacterium]